MNTTSKTEAVIAAKKLKLFKHGKDPFSSDDSMEELILNEESNDTGRAAMGFLNHVD